MIETDNFDFSSSDAAPAQREKSAHREGSSLKGEDRQDRAIRPVQLQDYQGQPRVREQMEIFIGAAQARGEALDHTLVFGPPLSATGESGSAPRSSVSRR